MALPYVLFENLYEQGTVTATSAASGFPATNLIDWRMATAFRWKASSATSPQYLTVDLGASLTLAPNTVVIGGHNLATALGTDGGVSNWTVQRSSDGTAWTNAHTAAAASTDKALGTTFTDTAFRYWRLRLQGTFSVAPQIGVLTLGRRLDFEGNMPDGFDGYGFDLLGDGIYNERRSPIGSNVIATERRFQINITDAGFSRDGFFRGTVAAHNWDDDMTPHIERGKPFWFQWDRAEAPTAIDLCWCTSVRMPFLGSYKRRQLLCEFVAYREVA